VRRFLAVCLACLFTVLIAADCLVCPDGCTDDAPVEALASHASAPCGLCQGWSHSLTVVASRPVSVVMADVPPRSVRLLAPALPPLDHPPRTA
jgi:hypothetical protein